MIEACAIFFLLALIASALFSGFENGMIQVRQARLDHAVSDGMPAAKHMKFFLDNPAKMLGCILLGNVLANVLAAVFFDNLIQAAAGAWLLEEASKVMTRDQAIAAISLLTTVLLTLVMLVFGEVTPKVWFRQQPFNRCRLAVWPIYLFFRCTGRAVQLLSHITLFIQRRLLHDENERELPASQMREELRHMLLESEEAGLVDSDVRNMVLTALDLPNRGARSIMVARDDVLTVDEKATLARAAKVAIKRKCARLPVQNQAGEWIGVFSLYDALFRVARERWSEEAVVTWMRPLHTIDGQTRLRDVLHAANAERSPLLVVVDGEGGQIGIVTTHDVTSTLFANLAN